MRHLDENRFDFERALSARGLGRIAGVDEAGRGPLAGPVVAAAVVLPPEWIRDGLPDGLLGLNDSKQLTPIQRDGYFTLLERVCEVTIGVAVVESEEIDQRNILRATHQAMLRALRRLPIPPEHVLVDGLAVDVIGSQQTAVVKGDARSFSIAAASVVAKVTRDRLMVEYEARWPGYGFSLHKGYPTPGHLEALRRLGPCPIHRRSFAPVAALLGGGQRSARALRPTRDAASMMETLTIPGVEEYPRACQAGFEFSPP